MLDNNSLLSQVSTEPSSVSLWQKWQYSTATLRFRVVLAVAGILMFFASTLLYPPDLSYLWFALLITGFVALQFNLPLELLGGETNLIHVIALGGGLLYGPSWAAWSVTGGVLLGYLLRRKWSNSAYPGKSEENRFGLEALFAVGLQNIALVLGLGMFGWTQGIAFSVGLGSQIWPVAAGPMLFFAFVQVLIYLIDYQVRGPNMAQKLRSEVSWLAVLELLPLPFILVAVMSYQLTGLTALVALGGIPLILAALLYRVGTATRNLSRRLDELSTLNQISQSLQGVLDLDRLLNFLHIQISRFLEVDNFYVALYDKRDRLIWYPMAVKGGQHVSWKPRPLTDRLTDKVILERRPIMLPHPFQDGYRGTGLPPGESAPSAWLGVPLITTNQITGCLGVFSYDPGKGFTRQEMNWLETISGQVSVAIENALLFEQTQKRAAQLETLSQITISMTATLEPERVLEQVCTSVIQVVGGQHSAIFLSDNETGRVSIAHAYKLTAEFIQQNRSFSIAHDGRTRCLRSGHPSIITDLRLASLDMEFKVSLQREGIRTFGDFPLSTPEGQIGYLSLYFDEDHSFTQEELALLQTFAAQAALAVSNARLYARTDKDLSRLVNKLSALEVIGRELAVAKHSNKIFDLILNLAMESSHARWGNIRLHDTDSGGLIVKAYRGYKGTPAENGKSQAGDDALFGPGEIVYIPDTRTNPAYIDFTNGKARSQLSIPLVHEEHTLGVLTLESPQLNAFSNSEIAFVSQLVNQATFALVNAGLHFDAKHDREKLRAVLKYVDGGIMMVDATGKIMLVNDAMQNFTDNELSDYVGMHLADLPPEVLECLGFSPIEACDLPEFFEKRDLALPEERRIIFARDGAEQSAIRILQPVWDWQDKIIGWMVILRNTANEFRVSQPRELLNETLVHDLRSPISAVLGALDVMYEAMSTSMPGKEEIMTQAVQVARRSAQRMLGLVESLLDIARLESGVLEISTNRLNLRALATAVASDFGNQAQEYGVILRNEVSEDLPVVNADLQKMQRILSHLVDNALNFTPEGGQVVLSADWQGEDLVTLQVKDSGPGIPQEYRTLVFDRFAQIPGLRGRRRGPGLGLTYCRLAIEAHGGRIWVEPGAGGGSVFLLTLPLVNKEK